MMTMICNCKVVSHEIQIANNFLKRLVGYMFRRKPHVEAISFYPCSSIHTFFMKFPIDVLFINKNMRVVKKISRLPPGKVIFPVQDAVMVIEGKEGLFNDITIGDTLQFFAA